MNEGVVETALTAREIAVASLFCQRKPAESGLGPNSMHKPFRIGFLPKGSPVHQRMFECFTNAGFRGVRIQINRDHSMAMLRLRWGTHSRFRGQRQAHTCVLQLLRAGGFRLNPNDLSPIAFRGNGVEAAFCPVRLRISALAKPIRRAGS